MFDKATETNNFYAYIVLLTSRASSATDEIAKRFVQGAWILDTAKVEGSIHVC